ncbi:MAG: PAS domain S-box protein, partial [Flavobacteriaceae bacterium]|nr:PAS domain S-box protein [Flavobacteriaceae bacterium]
MKDLSNSSNNHSSPHPLEGFHVIDERGDIFKQVFRYSIIPTLIHDMDMNILDANDKALEEFGYSMEELKTLKIFDLHVEEELDHSAEVLEQMKKEKKLSVETKFRRKDGSIFDAEATPCKYILESKPLIHVFIQDITERKKAIKKIQEFNKLLENEVARRTTDLLIKNEELESFNYSVTHDLKAPLRVIEGYAQILKEDHSKTLSEEGQRFLDLIIKNTTQMQQLIHDILKMSKLSREELTLEEIDMKRLFEDVYEELSQSLDSRTINFRVDNLHNCI